MTLPTLALSIWQPWTWLLARGFKDVENRSWPAPASLIGKPVLLHAGKRACGISNAVHLALRNLSLDDFDRFMDAALSPERGGIVGVATLSGCIQNAASPWAEPGMFHWFFRDARPLPFVPCLGRQKLFRIPDHVKAQLLEAV